MKWAQTEKFENAFYKMRKPIGMTKFNPNSKEHLCQVGKV